MCKRCPGEGRRGLADRDERICCILIYSYTHQPDHTPDLRAHQNHISDVSEDTEYKHIDQLPPFNLSLLFTNELGYASYQRILGVDFVDDGVVNSIQDLFTERTLVFLAEDFTELMPLTLSSLYQPTDVGRTAKAPAF